MSSNRISTIATGSFKKLDHLNSLELQGNFLQDLLEGTFEGLPICCDIDLSSNSLANIADGAFNGLNRLNNLKLDHNVLTQITAHTWTGLQL